jgi:hypothetical protein
MWPSQDIFNFQSTLQQSINHHGPSQVDFSLNDIFAFITNDYCEDKFFNKRRCGAIR